MSTSSNDSDVRPKTPETPKKVEDEPKSVEETAVTPPKAEQDEPKSNVDVEAASTSTVTNDNDSKPLPPPAETEGPSLPTSTTTTTTATPTTDDPAPEASTSSGVLSECADTDRLARSIVRNAPYRELSVEDVDEILGTDAEEVTSEADEKYLSTVEITKDAHNRVKLYMLCEQRQWDDKGTGHVVCIEHPPKSNQHYLVVRLEGGESNILTSRIGQRKNYQRQQGTLIVWPESDSTDLALSFQERTGCEEVLEKIGKIQNKDLTTMEFPNDDDNGSDASDPGVANWQGMTLPECAVDNLREIESILNSSLTLGSNREMLSNTILSEDYVQKLCALFQQVEHAESTERATLSRFGNIARDMFMLNSPQLMNVLVKKDHLNVVLGMLEHDATQRKHKKHREFIKKSKFREILPITNLETRDKIHETYRVQYILDVCLPAPSMFDENLTSNMSSHLFFARCEIVTSCASDRKMMNQLFSELKSTETSLIRRKELVAFLKDFTAMATGLTAPPGAQGREQFFKALGANDVYQALDVCMSSTIVATQAMTIDIIHMIAEPTVALFRDYILKQQNCDDKELLTSKLLNYMLTDRDPEFSIGRSVNDIFRSLLDPESARFDFSESFFEIFYGRTLKMVLKPIIDLTAGGKLRRDDYYTSQLLWCITALLQYCAKNHETHMRQFVLSHDLLRPLLVFLQSKFHLNALRVLRLFRTIIDCNDDVYYRHIVEKKLFAPIVAGFNANGSRNNLLNSAYLNLFECIYTENITQLIKYIGDEYEADLFHVKYVKTMSRLFQRYRDHKEKLLKRQADEESMESRRNEALRNVPQTLFAQMKRERDHDEDDLFFSADDVVNENAFNDVEEDILPMRKSGSEPMFPSLGKRRHNDDDGVASVFGGSAPSLNVENIPKPSKITIKMPSLGGASLPNNESTKESSPPPQSVPIKQIPPISRLKKTSLVNYDSSDSDSDDEDSEAGQSQSAPASLHPCSPGISEASPEASTSSAPNNEDSRVSSAPPTISVDEDSSSVLNGETRKRRRTLEDEEPAVEADTNKRSRSSDSSPVKAEGNNHRVNGFVNTPSSPQSCSVEVIGKRLSPFVDEGTAEDAEREDTSPAGNHSTSSPAAAV